MHLTFMLFSIQFYKSSTIFGLKMFQTVYKRTLCDRRVARGATASPNSESSTKNFEVNQTFDV